MLVNLFDRLGSLTAASLLAYAQAGTFYDATISTSSSTDSFQLQQAIALLSNWPASEPLAWNDPQVAPRTAGSAHVIGVRVQVPAGEPTVVGPPASPFLVRQCR